MKKLHTIETIQEKGEVLFTAGEAQEKLTVYAYDGLLLYDGADLATVEEDTSDARKAMFVGIAWNLAWCDNDYTEEIAKLKAMAEYVPTVQEEIRWILAMKQKKLQN